MGLVFARYGYLVINISYRLAPQHPFPAAIQDTCAAYGWLAKHVHELGGDPARVAVAGESAGGNLISALTIAACQQRSGAVGARGVRQRPRAARRDAVLRHARGVAARSASRSAGRLPALDRRNDPRRVRVVPAWPLGDAVGPGDRARGSAADHRDHAASSISIAPRVLRAGRHARIPCSTTRAGSPPRSREAQRAPCEARYYPGGIHAFHAMVWNPAARRCWRDALAFLDRHMR